MNKEKEIKKIVVVFIISFIYLYFQPNLVDSNTILQEKNLKSNSNPLNPEIKTSANNPGNFTLSIPDSDKTISGGGVPVTFTWTASEGADNYSMYVSDKEITTITGKTDIVRKNRIFMFYAVSTDPEGDKIYYRLKVDENKPSHWLGPRDSGQRYATGWGIFEYTGEITIGVQAKDIYGAESDWSYHTLTITTSKSKLIGSSLINILQNYPILYQLLLKFL